MPWTAGADRVKMKKNWKQKENMDFPKSNFNPVFSSLKQWYVSVRPLLLLPTVINVAYSNVLDLLSDLIQNEATSLIFTELQFFALTPQLSFLRISPFTVHSNMFLPKIHFFSVFLVYFKAVLP